MARFFKFDDNYQPRIQEVQQQQQTMLMYIIIKLLKASDKEKILKYAYNRKTKIRIMADVSSETVQVRNSEAYLK